MRLLPEFEYTVNLFDLLTAVVSVVFQLVVVSRLLLRERQLEQERDEERHQRELEQERWLHNDG